jgi:hypothetical protein
MWYKLTAQHIQPYNTSLRYLSSRESIETGERIHDFYLKYLKPYFGQTSLIPEFNPVEGYEFSAGQRPKDMYHHLGKLDRHFIISPRFNEILMEYKLSGHIVFDNVTLKNRISSRSDFKYIHFYESMWDYVDIKSSTFYLHEKNDYKEIRKIKFRSKNDYEYAIENTYKGNNKRVSEIEIVIPGINEYDLFPLFNITGQSFFMSERLHQRIRKDKITGFRGDVFKGFNIGG